MSLIQEIKLKEDVFSLWRRINPESAPCRDGLYRSPFRDEKKESFSVSRSGTRFKDFATGDGGDVIDMAMILWSCDKKEAVRRLHDGSTTLPPLPAKRIQPPRIIDREKLARLTKQVICDFRIENDSVTSRFLDAKSIPVNIARILNKEGSLGEYKGSPSYVFGDGIKVRYDAETSRSTRWLIGNAGGVPWRFRTLNAKIKTIILTESESDAMKSMASLQSLDTRTVRVIAAPSASWRPGPEILSAITKDRRLIVAVDNDDAGKALTQWLMRRVPSCIPFPWDMAWEHGDLCDIDSGDLTHIYRGLIRL